jgi:N-methylhydantoinase A/oxoprolinase/acetone carboxylase beta subunit
MSLLLGIDTGGTYTDAVIFDESDGVIATAKALTTRHDLSIGISGAAVRVMSDSGADPNAIAMVSISTTLATNALVEGQGGRVGLILIGFDAASASRANLIEALRGDPCVLIGGGHGAHGDERNPLDLDALNDALADLNGKVDAYAVASLFAVRNPAHEQAVRARILEATGKPVTCSCELSSRLDGPRRAMTCVLNARLLPMIDRLLVAATKSFKQLSIQAPMMVVRGDGALIRASVARERPVETILSGPAASLVGAAHLADAPNAMVSDIGGTTTDYALMVDGRPCLDADGATVGGFRTMVEAVAMQTVGLGGDSEVALIQKGLGHALVLGPRRMVPISLLAVDHGPLVRDALTRQARGMRRGELVGRFVVPVAHASQLQDANEREREILDRLGDAPQALDDLLQSQRELGTINVLVSRGQLALAGVTPSDAAHVLGMHTAWDVEAAQMAMELFAGQKNGLGLAVAEDAATIAEEIVEALAMRSAEALLDAGCAEDGLGHQGVAALLLAAREASPSSLVKFNVQLNRPVVALGASAHAYYPRVAERLGTQVLVPTHAEVANAVGAVVGRVRIRVTGTIAMPDDSRYRVFVGEEPSDHPALEEAVAAARSRLEAEAIGRASAAGADDVELAFEREDRVAVIEGLEKFVESDLAVTVTGRPRFTSN